MNRHLTFSSYIALDKACIHYFTAALKCYFIDVKTYIYNY